MYLLFSKLAVSWLPRGGPDHYWRLGVRSLFEPQSYLSPSLRHLTYGSMLYSKLLCLSSNNFKNKFLEELLFINFMPVVPFIVSWRELILIEYWICLGVLVNVEGVCELSEGYSVEWKNKSLAYELEVRRLSFISWKKYRFLYLFCFGCYTSFWNRHETAWTTLGPVSWLALMGLCKSSRDKILTKIWVQ